jgi:hypothetical protein
MALTTRHEKGCRRMAFPERANKLKRVKTSDCAGALHRVRRQKKAAHHIEVAVLSRRAEELKEGPRIVSSNESLRVSPCLEEHDGRGGRPVRMRTELLLCEEGPEFLGGRQHWLVSLDLCPHLLLRSVAERLVVRVTQGDAEEEPAPGSQSFRSDRLPSISVEEYMERLSVHADCTPTTFVVALVYLLRGVDSGMLTLTSLTIHRALLAAAATAAKFVEDEPASDRDFCRAGGVSGRGLWRLETALAAVLQWRFYVGAGELQAVAESLREDDKDTLGL